MDYPEIINLAPEIEEYCKELAQKIIDLDDSHFIEGVKEDKEWMYAQRNCNELGADYFSYQGYHPPKEPPLDEQQGYPYYGITHSRND